MQNYKKIHFIGIGGIGISSLAYLSLEEEKHITGSDSVNSDLIDDLRDSGAHVSIGHDGQNVTEDTELVIYTEAIDRENNPEYQRAKDLDIPTLSYFEALGQISRTKKTVAVVGTHGKTTTTAMLGLALVDGGVDPTVIVGSKIKKFGQRNIYIGKGDIMAVEGCEYRRSFLSLYPFGVVFLNCEAEHLDYYKDETEIVDAFCQFAHGVKSGGVIIANGQDSNVTRIVHKLPSDLRCETFGLDENCDFYAQNIQLTDGLHTFDVYHRGKLLGKTRISVPGNHNILNALAVAAMAINSGLQPCQILELLPNFNGIDRRLMLKGQIDQITVLDDYAHHPTEIKASLQAIRQKYEPNHIWCVFQPHQYSRTRFLLDDFAKSFKLCDVTIVPEIYFARDSILAKKEVNSGILVERIRSNGTDAVYIDDFSSICDYLKDNVTAGDVVVTMGAGNIWKVADEYIQWLRGNS